MNSYHFENNIKLAEAAAEEGIVLLKNNGVLPFERGAKVGILGGGCLLLVKGGGGSADVISACETTVLSGLESAETRGMIYLDRASVAVAKNGKYTIETLNALAKKTDVFVYTLSRYASEGGDRQIADPADETEQKTNAEAVQGEVYSDPNGGFITAYRLTKNERAFFSMIEKSDVQSVVLIANTAGLIDFSELENYPKIKAIVLAFLPGMSGGEAIAKILTGEVNPSGRLSDTAAKAYEDYPSAATFNISCDNADYTEDIYVGYRHFETHAPEKVLYPFGFGLSYTKFAIENVEICENAGGAAAGVRITATVKNTGRRAGKTVLQCYVKKSETLSETPAKELCAYKKTPLLAAGESVEIVLEIAPESFEKYVSGKGYVTERGEYSLYLGENVRSAERIGAITMEKETCRETKDYVSGAPYKRKETAALPQDAPSQKPSEKILLSQVESGEKSMREFLAQLKNRELLHLAQGQLCAFPRATSGVGDLEEYGVPNPQTADGPAGIRRATKASCFPCGTLLACTWNEEIITAVGAGLGEEGVSTGVDIVLAPSMNIHRNPLCGRNFEYYSEDPYLTGKTAAAMVRGIQSTGLLACVKHFFANNCEDYRMAKSSNLSERAAREIYLKGFEITVKESDPAFIMTSYNLVNHIKSSTFAGVLRGIVREEWGYCGAIMTDWRNNSRLWQELFGGNNIKMPLGYPDEEDLAMEKLQEGVLTRELLEENAEYVLNAVRKSHRFKTGFFGNVIEIDDNKKTKLPIDNVLGLSSTWLFSGVREDGEKYLYNVSLDQRNYPCFFVYKVDFKRSGEYCLRLGVKTDTPATRIFIEIDGELKTIIPCVELTDKERFYNVQGVFFAEKGIRQIKIMPVVRPDEKFCRCNGWHTPKEFVGIGDIYIENNR